MRREHTRKTLRFDTNRDLIHILLVHYDPYISTLRRLKLKKESELPFEVCMLLKTEDDTAVNSNDSENNDNGDDIFNIPCTI